MAEALKDMEKGLEAAQDFNKYANKGKDAQKATQKEKEQLGEYVNKGTSDLPGRNGAFKEAKRDAGIPRAQQPEKIESVPMRSAEYEGGHVLKDSKGNVIMTREYHYTNNSGEKLIIQDHSAGHTKGGQGPHFNVRPADKPRTGKKEGTKEHYPFN
ncbi:HNH/endonuclease VII fold putative polymorphic toxin [Lysinibacillus sp. UGB7]|uniref:HNH/endonuclease VII fold putative polymorphic toxin n=1 Tax=Lysinibacillus sp. UGB7 TaxID=3411039 RepID=UPI003B81BC54